MGPHHEVSLCGAPELRLAVFANVGEAGVRLDVTLMHRSSLELPLNNDIGSGKAGFDVPVTELDSLGDV
jgi:hypothetical protein